MKKYLVAVLLLTISLLSAFKVREGELFVEVSIAAGDTLRLDAISLYVLPLDCDSMVVVETPASLAIQMYQQEEYLLTETEFNPLSSFYYMEPQLVFENDSLYVKEQHYAPAGRPDIPGQERLESGKVVSRLIEHGIITLTDNIGNTYQLPTGGKMEAIALTTKGRDGTYSGEFRPVIHDKQITLIQEVSLEEYLIGVVASEIGDYSPDEALKAQAVAARTKTLRTLLFPKTENTPEDFCNTTNVQVYRGSDKVKPNIREAVQATSGEILIYDGQVIDAVFSSNSGGVTESNQYIWDGMPIPYLQSVVDEPEAVKLDLTSNEDAGKWIDRKIMPSLTDDIASWQRKYYYWDRNVHIEDLEKISGIDHIRSVVVEKRGKSGRIMKLKLVGNTEKRYTNELQIRKLFGNLPSSLCYFTRTKSGFKVIGRGYGHGVGMCQSGAIMRALNGEDYRKILNKYYTNVELTRIHIGKN